MGPTLGLWKVQGPVMLAQAPSPRVIPLQFPHLLPAHSWGGGRGRELEPWWALSQTSSGLAGHSQSLMTEVGQGGRGEMGSCLLQEGVVSKLEGSS